MNCHAQKKKSPKQKEKIEQNATLDSLEFPRGYILGSNDYHTCASSGEQLQSYPLPRYKPGVNMHRNMNLAKSGWMADVLSNGPQKPENYYKIRNAIIIQNELAENWNYYYSFTENAAFAMNCDDTLISLNAAFINDINTSGKKYPLAAMSYRRMTNITDLKNAQYDYSKCPNLQPGKGDQKTLIMNQELESDQPAPPCTYPKGTIYPRNESGEIILPGGAARKTWSPLESARKVYQGDGHLIEYYFDRFINTARYHLNADAVKRIELIGENNEICPRFAENNKRSVLADDPKIVKAAAVSPFNGNIDLLQASAKKNIDNDYRDAIMKSKRLNIPSNALFFNYDVDGFGIPYKHLYSEMRETNSLIDGHPLPTPYYYIKRPPMWNKLMAGADHGWAWLAIERYHEIYDDGYGHAFNDKWFAPFVSAGYNTNAEVNTRPGQYLGFMKALMLQGASFFFPFFADFIQQGNSFCWQVSTPSYVQAIGSRIYHFLEYGKTLFGDYVFDNKYSGGIPSFRFKSDSEDYLITVRQDADEKNNKPLNRYVIVGAIMKSSADIGASPLTANATFILNKEQLKIPIRRQGSTYLFDSSDKDHIVFYQLDKWHQFEHPDRWSKDFEFEAEVYDNAEAGDWEIRSEGIKKNQSVIDLTDVTSYIHFKTASSTPILYTFQPRKDHLKNNYGLLIKARAEGNTSVTIALSNGKEILKKNSISITSSKWEWFEATPGQVTYQGLNDEDERYELQLTASNKSAEIDAIKLILAR